MNWTDIIIGALLAWAGIRGLMKGFILELATLLGLVLGLYAGLHFSKFAAEMIRDTFKVDGFYLPVLSFAVVFILVILGTYLIGKLMDKSADLVFLGWLNKALGLLFGLAKMVLVLSFLLMILNSFAPSGHLLPEKLRKDSMLYGPVESIAPKLMPKIKEIRIPDKPDTSKIAGPQAKALTGRLRQC